MVVEPENLKDCRWEAGLLKGDGWTGPFPLGMLYPLVAMLRVLK